VVTGESLVPSAWATLMGAQKRDNSFGYFRGLLQDGEVSCVRQFDNTYSVSEPVSQFPSVSRSNLIVETLDHHHRRLTRCPPLLERRGPRPGNMRVVGGVPNLEVLHDARIGRGREERKSGRPLPLFI